jgi:hypothetical protein
MYSVVLGKFTAIKASKNRSFKFRSRDTKLQHVRKGISSKKFEPCNEPILMIDGASYSGNLPFSKHQSADRPNFLLGIQKQNVQIKFLQ